MMDFGSPIFAQKEKDPKPETRRIPRSPSPSSTIPFSWEHQPGVPKFSARNPMKATSDPNLPLPPPSKSAADVPRRKQRPDRYKFGSDPFADALAECTKTKHPPPASFADVAGESCRQRRRAFAGPALLRVGDRVGFMAGIFGSCKEAAACSVSEAAVYVPSRGDGYGNGYGYGLLMNRRLR